VKTTAMNMWDHALWSSCLMVGALSLLCFGSTRCVSQMMPASTVTSTKEGLANGFIEDVSTSAPIHIMVGRSMLVSTANRLAKVYVTNPAIIDSYTASPNQLVVAAKQPGVSSLIVWDESGHSQTYLISSDINVDRLKESMKQALPNEKIEVRGEEGRVVLSGITGTTANSDTAARLAGLYSKDVSNAVLVNPALVKQVSLKVRIVEIDRTKLDQFGFNFFSAGGNNLAQTTTTQFPTTLSASAAGSSSSSTGTSNSVGSKTVSVLNALNFLIYSSRLNIGATLQDLESKQVLQVLAEPTISALSGQKANFLAGGEFPFPVVQGGAGGLTSISIQFRPYGVKLDFTPEVNSDGTIALRVSPEVSALDYTNAVQISGYTIPALSTRRADTQVVLRSGQSFAISGLLDRRTTDLYNNTPGASSIPILGHLFRSKSVNHSTTELMVIVTPTTIDPMADTLPEPKMAVPMLDPKSFDPSLPQPKEKK
jgi:pilus assembly protein CpaC